MLTKIQLENWLRIKKNMHQLPTKIAIMEDGLALLRSHEKHAIFSVEG
jgi:hypothetical protein